MHVKILDASGTLTSYFTTGFTKKSFGDESQIFKNFLQHLECLALRQLRELGNEIHLIDTDSANSSPRSWWSPNHIHTQSTNHKWIVF